jgi:hypothetical protein
MAQEQAAAAGGAQGEAAAEDASGGESGEKSDEDIIDAEFEVKDGKK